jgi:adenine-specific DNA-methyltransferase
LLIKTHIRVHSWLSMVVDRLKLGRILQKPDGIITVSIDDAELDNLVKALQASYGKQELAKLVWDRNRKNDAKYFSVGHEYMLVFANNADYLKEKQMVFREPKEGLSDARVYFARIRREHGDDWGKIREAWLKWFETIPVSDPRRRLMRFSKVGPKGPYRDDGDLSWPGGGGPRYEVIHPVTKMPTKIPRGGCDLTP